MPSPFGIEFSSCIDGAVLRYTPASEWSFVPGSSEPLDRWARVFSASGSVRILREQGLLCLSAVSWKNSARTSPNQEES